MADRQHTPAGVATLPPMTADALLADRQRFWGAFTNFTVGGMVAVVIAILVMLYFIL